MENKTKSNFYKEQELQSIHIQDFIPMEKKVKKLSKRRITNEYIINIIGYIIMNYLLLIVKSQKNSNYQIIKMKINITGNVDIYHENYQYKPDKITLNGEEEACTNQCNIVQSNSIIKLIWENKLYSTTKLFQGCSGISEIDLSDFDTSLVTQMDNMFYGCSSLTSINFNNFDTTNVTRFDKMFSGCSKLESIDLSRFQTFKAKNMGSMFKDCIKLVNLDLSKFSTHQVTNMKYMFHGCSDLEYLNVSSFDTSLVEEMEYMFSGCSNLKVIELSNFNTKNVNDMSCMFYGCSSLQSLDLSNFNTQKVTNMSYMFYNCFKLNCVNLKSFDTSHVKYMNNMFFGSKSLSSLDLTNFITSQVTQINDMFQGCKSLTTLNISNFDVSRVGSLGGMFLGCSSLISLDLSNFNTSRVNVMGNMFKNCKSLKFLNLSNFDTSKVISMSYMFQGCSNLTSINLYNFITSRTEYMNHMFDGCKSLISLDLSNFNTNKINNMNAMFRDCSSLEYLNISNFDTSQVTYMGELFCGCSSLTSLELSNLDTSKATNICAIFKDCSSLKSINLSNFNLSNDQHLDFFFYGCSSLTSIDLSNFNTSKVLWMGYMFYGCSNLTSLDLSNFDTPKLQSIQHAFEGCISLTTLNLSNFNTNNMRYMNHTFKGCTSLEYINLKNFYKNNLRDYVEIFKEIPDNIVICYNDFVSDNDKIYKQILEKKCHIIDCSDDWKSKQKKIINNTGECADSCNYIYTYQYEYKGKCYDNCTKGYIVNNSTHRMCKCQLDKCLTCPFDIPFNNLCTKCNDDYYPKEYDDLNTSEYFDCYKNPEGFYLDKNELIYKKCYNTCETCEIKGNLTNHNCLKCKYNLTFELNNYNFEKNSNYKNCYYKCKYYYYFDKNGIYHCTENISCPEDYDKLIQDRNECTNNCSKDEIYKYENNNICIKEEISNNNNFINYKILEINKEILNWRNSNYTSEEINIKIYEKITNNILQNFIVSKEEEVIIQGKDNYSYLLTSLDNISPDSNNNKTSNKFSKIDLGECENILREKNGINDNTSLLILLLEKQTSKSSERNVQFEIYESEKKTKLNLSVCNEIPIDIYVPLVLSKEIQNLHNELKDLGYNLFDINDKFYQDICTPYKSPNNTDVLLSDRKNFYYNNDETQCQPGCSVSNYSIEKQFLKCECSVSNTEINTKNIKEESSKSIYKSFFDVLKYSNYKVLKCYNLAFKLNIFTENIGSILTLVYFFIYFITLILYFIKGISELKSSFLKFNEIENINNKHIPIIFDKSRKKSNIFSINKSKFNKKKIPINKQNNIIYQKKEPNNNKNNKFLFQKAINKKKLIKKKIFYFPPKKVLNNVKNNYNYQNNPVVINKNSINIYRRKLQESKKKEKIINIFKKLPLKILNAKMASSKEKYDDYELNNMEYNEALKYDTRQFLKIYWSLLKREHLIIFTFCTRNDHNIIYIKFTRLIFLICTDMALNVFFFSDETMHKMFLDYGKYNFFQQVPQIIYSTIVSQLIEIFLCYLSLTDKHYYQMKNLKIKKSYDLIHILKVMKIKNYFFYIITFILFFFYWYTITCFCSVYSNTQKAFIKDSILSFVFGLLYPFGLYLIPSFLRIISLRNCNGKLSFTYKLSEIIPFF